MRKFLVACLLVFSSTAFADNRTSGTGQGMTGSPVSTPDTRADAARRSAETAVLIEKETRIQRQKAYTDARLNASVDKMLGRTAQIKSSVNYPITVYDPNLKKEVSLPAKATVFKKYTPTASKLAKALGKGIGMNLIALAIYDLLGKGVDYLLDPKNHEVKIKSNSNEGFYCSGNVCASSPEALCNDLAQRQQVYESKRYGVAIKVVSHSVSESMCVTKEFTFKEKNGASHSDYFHQYPISNTQEKTLSYEEVAEHAMKQADNGNAEAQNGIKEIVKEMIVNNDNDVAINDNDITNNETDVVNQYNTTNNYNQTEPQPKTEPKHNAEPQPKTEPKTDDQHAPAFELPAFCDWAKHVCDFIDWVKEPPSFEPDDDYKPKIKDLSHLAEQDINKNYYNTDEQCPPDVVVEFPFGNITISYKYYCDFAVKISPLVVALAYIFGAFIIARGR